MEKELLLLKQEFERIKNLGYVQSSRKGYSGIGKTAILKVIFIFFMPHQKVKLILKLKDYVTPMVIQIKLKKNVKY